MLTRAKIFINYYRLPLRATLVFVIVVVAMLLSRTFEHLALADVLGKNNKDRGNYSKLLSQEKNDKITKNSVDEQQEDNKSASTVNQTTNNYTASSTPFTVSPSPTSSGGGTDTGGGSTGGGGGDVPSTGGGTDTGGGSTGGGGGGSEGENTSPAGPFNAYAETPIFNPPAQETIYCSSGGSGTAYPCAKKYYFRSRIFAHNGPGSISGQWRLEATSIMDKNFNFSVGQGTTYTDIYEYFQIPCTATAMTFRVKVLLITPNTFSSNYLQFPHSCF